MGSVTSTFALSHERVARIQVFVRMRSLVEAHANAWYKTPDLPQFALFIHCTLAVKRYAVERSPVNAQRSRNDNVDLPCCINVPPTRSTRIRERGMVVDY